MERLSAGKPLREQQTAEDINGGNPVLVFGADKRLYNSHGRHHHFGASDSHIVYKSAEILYQRHDGRRCKRLIGEKDSWKKG